MAGIGLIVRRALRGQPHKATEKAIEVYDEAALGVIDDEDEQVYQPLDMEQEYRGASIADILDATKGSEHDLPCGVVCMVEGKCRATCGAWYEREAVSEIAQHHTAVGGDGHGQTPPWRVGSVLPRRGKKPFLCLYFCVRR